MLHMFAALHTTVRLLYSSKFFFHCCPYFRWRSEVNSTDRAHPKSVPLSLTLPSSHALTQSASQEWSSLLRPHQCRGLLNPKGGRARWVFASVYNSINNGRYNSLCLSAPNSLATFLLVVSAALFTLFFSFPSCSSSPSLCSSMLINSLHTQPCKLLPFGLLLRLAYALFLFNSTALPSWCTAAPVLCSSRWLTWFL